jgi:hypothetical protein
LDVFVFYRDEQGAKKRAAPDVLIAPFVTLTPEQGAGSYDLDVEPTPTCLIELTSPASHTKDIRKKPSLYCKWGVPEYLVLDIVDHRGRWRQQVDIYLWRFGGGDYHRVLPDKEGYVTLESVGIRFGMDGRSPVIQEVATGKVLTTKQEDEERAEREAQRADEATKQAEREARLRQETEAKLKQVQEELQRLKGKGK